tara:strand:- start:988 stop:1593 length:606 start_codon:yes stop_codon:yes gene_type:complete
MNSVYNFIVKPFKERYNNVLQVGEKELIINTSIEDHKFVSKKAIVVSVPIAYKTEIKPGDEVVIHHNVFRRWYDMRGVEKNSSLYFKDDEYFCTVDQVYLYKRDGEYKPNLDYCFVKPVINKDEFSIDKEKPLTGVVKYTNKRLLSLGVKKDDLITFSPYSEFEFLIDDQRLYCMKSNDIVINHGHKEDQEEYNPSWANSG